MRNSDLAISIKDLTKFYKDLQALDKISFEVKRGDFFAFLGPNGAGKTTTINAVTGLSNYQSGEVKVFGYAEKLCKTIGIINNGKIDRIGDKKQILQDKSLQDVFLEITGIE